MNQKNIMYALLILIMGFNLILTYVLLWNPYNLFFDKPELSYINYELREPYAIALATANFLILWTSIIWSYFKWVRKNKIRVIAPIVVSILTLWTLMKVQDNYPDGQSEWTENGYQIKTQSWHLDGQKVFKRWRSQDSLKKYKSYQEIIWELDSLNEE